MIIVLKHNVSENDIKIVTEKITEFGYDPRVIKGVENTVIGAVGDEEMHQTLEVLNNLPCVEKVMAIQKKHKLVSRQFHPEDSIITFGKKDKVGNGNFTTIGGPCAVESLEQMQQVARDLKAVGINTLRGGAFKPRTSPYDFQGHGEKGLDILQQVKEEYDMAIITEIVAVSHIEKVAAVADCLQIGARNSQNFHLLAAVAEAGKPVMLKRGMSSTVAEWLSAAEYLMVNGCHDVILCERGIRTFETSTRNTLDIGAIAVAKRESHLPVMVDPSHAAGRLDLVLPLAKAAIAAGADGLIVEAHPTPMTACSDAAQQIPSAEFGEFLKEIKPFIDLVHNR